MSIDVYMFDSALLSGLLMDHNNPTDRLFSIELENNVRTDETHNTHTFSSARSQWTKSKFIKWQGITKRHTQTQTHTHGERRVYYSELRLPVNNLFFLYLFVCWNFCGLYV